MMLSQPPVNDAAGDLMNIAIPKEIKKQEYRVGLLPSVAYQLVQQGHTVLVERGAGVVTGYPDADYEQAGAKLIDDHEALFNEGDLVVKVKEPLPEEYGLLRPGQVLFTYFHLAADRELTEAVCRSGVTALAYETIEVNGRLPLFEATQSGAENRTPRRCRDNKCPVVMSLAFGQTD